MSFFAEYFAGILGPRERDEEDPEWVQFCQTYDPAKTRLCSERNPERRAVKALVKEAESQGWTKIGKIQWDPHRGEYYQYLYRKENLCQHQ